MNQRQLRKRLGIEEEPIEEPISRWAYGAVLGLYLTAVYLACMSW